MASSVVTADGRPLLWKIRDNSDLPNNSVSYDTSYPHRFIAVTNSGDKEVWMGVNDKGFAIINSTALDLPGGTSGFNNGLLMQYALGTCASVSGFIRLLDSTNEVGRRTQGNFGVIDTMGNAGMFEVGGNVYRLFDANDASLTPERYVLRTNFSVSGGGRTGIERYRRAANQIAAFRLGDTLDYRRIIRYHARDFSDLNSNPVPVPYPREWYSGNPLGYIHSSVSICRHKSVSASVIVGVRPGERALTSTLWTILGQPATGIAVPYWAVGEPPGAATGSTTSPLDSLSREIRSQVFDFSASADYLDSYKLRDECGNGLWAVTFPAEDSILNATDQLLEAWRRGMTTVRRMLAAENSFAFSALSHTQRGLDLLVRRVPFTVSSEKPYEDENGRPLENGDVIQLIWAGRDELIDPPRGEIGDPLRGQPTGDDRLIGYQHAVGENVSAAGMFRFQMIVWPARVSGFPASEDFVYVRAFNSNNLESATHHGDAQLFRLVMRGDHAYTPVIKGGRTSRPLGGFLARGAVPARVKLAQNYPNPFNSSTSVEYEAPFADDTEGPVELIVFNNLGQAVRTLFAGLSPGGKQRMVWDGTDNAGKPQPSGVYYLRLKTGVTTTIARMLLLK